MKWRLALKLDVAGHKADGQPAGGAIGWAALRLGPEKTAGKDRIPYEELDGPGEVRIMAYTQQQDMLEPMPLDQYEERVKVLAGTLPEECRVIRVPFDATAFASWLVKTECRDSHEARARWANDLRM